MLKSATSKELQQWDELVAANPDGGNVLQATAFGDTKARHGWHVRHFLIGGVAVLILVRRIPLLGEYWYIPKGPGVAGLPQLEKVVSGLQKTRAFCVRMDPEILESKVESGSLEAIGLIKSRRDIQYNISTIMVDLAPSEEDILASFKQKTRYNIRLAVKKGVTVQAVDTSPDAMLQLYEMSQTTYDRAGVYVRDQSYFQDYWSLHAKQGTGQMFFAYFEDKPVAGAFITFLGTSGLYKDGASYRDHPELQAPYLLQWEIMRWLKARGIKEYDLHGVPPKASINDSGHALAGLARFKRGFNPEITEFIGTYDLVLDVKKYMLWSRIGERLAMSYESRFRGRLFY